MFLWVRQICPAKVSARGLQKHMTIKELRRTNGGSNELNLRNAVDTEEILEHIPWVVFAFVRFELVFFRTEILRSLSIL